MIKNYKIPKNILFIIFEYNLDLYTYYVINKNFNILFLKFKISNFKKNKKIFVFKNCLDFFQKKDLLKFCFLSKFFRKKIFDVFFKRIFLKKNILKNERILFWEKYSKVFDVDNLLNKKTKIKNFKGGSKGIFENEKIFKGGSKGISSKNLKIEKNVENEKIFKGGSKGISSKNAKFEKKLKILELDKKEKIQIEKDIYRTYDFIKKKELSKNLKKIIENSILSYTKKFSYYQGFNNIAGFFLLYTKKKNLSEKILKIIIKKNLKKIFKKNFENINFLFFVLNLELKKNFEKLFSHFEKIDLRLDSILTSYIFTIFTSALNFKNFENIFFIEKIFDFFFVYNWKSIIIICLFVFEIHENFLLNLNFEEILFYFNKINSNFSLFFSKNENFQEFFFKFFEKMNFKQDFFDFYYELYLFVENDICNYRKFLEM